MARWSVVLSYLAGLVSEVTSTLRLAKESHFSQPGTNLRLDHLIGGQLMGEDTLRRVKFYGAQDLATWVYMERVAELIDKFEVTDTLTATADAIELHNVQQYIENALLPQTYTADQRARAGSLAPRMRSSVARFFSAVGESNCAAIVAGINHNYHSDLLELLGKNRAYERCSPAIMLPALDAAGVHIGQMLACGKLVGAYQSEMRERLLASPQNAEHVIRKYLEKNTHNDIHLPANLTTSDVRDLLERYLDSPDANPNYVRLIETASSQHVVATGIDAKLKLKAKRRNAAMTQKLFEETAGIRMGVEVCVSDTQDEPAVSEMDNSDGILAQLSYSSHWLEETLDYPSILNNFQHLFEFTNPQVLLNFPSYPARLGVFERFMGVAGKNEYPVGVAFRVTEMSSLLQARLYQHYLETKSIDLEDVITWFFRTYLADEFAATNFSFTRSTPGTSFLEKVRHLFVEMESIVNQFRQFVDNGEIDPELLAIGSDPIAYKRVPSLLNGKYIYSTHEQEITGILHALFSDQSSLAYISEDLRGGSAAELLLKNEVSYGDFHEHQRGAIDQLIGLGILQDTGTHVTIAKPQQFLILHSLFSNEAASYFHLSESGRAEADSMEKRGWVTRRSSLLTEAEAAYFNFMLNKVEFSNGPELRNKYLHGSQVNADGEDAHFQTYITVLKLLISLVIKMNDDFCLSAAEPVGVESSAQGE